MAFSERERNPLKMQCRSCEPVVEPFDREAERLGIMEPIAGRPAADGLIRDFDQALGG
jgi:hypothetical protein